MLTLLRRPRLSRSPRKVGRRLVEQLPPPRAQRRPRDAGYDDGIRARAGGGRGGSRRGCEEREAVPLVVSDDKNVRRVDLPVAVEVEAVERCRVCLVDG